MKRVSTLEHRFVDAMPVSLEFGVLYVSMRFSTVVHMCCCGCSTRVVTPLSPVGWQLYFDGQNVTLYPSVGNHQYECKSHYWIRDGKVEWSYQCTATEIEIGRAATRRARAALYDHPSVRAVDDKVQPASGVHETLTGWERLKERLRRVE